MADDVGFVDGGHHADHRHVDRGHPPVLELDFEAALPFGSGGTASEIPAAVHAQVAVDGATVVEPEQQPLADRVDIGEHAAGEIEVCNARVACDRA